MSDTNKRNEVPLSVIVQVALATAKEFFVGRRTLTVSADKDEHQISGDPDPVILEEVERAEDPRGGWLITVSYSSESHGKLYRVIHISRLGDFISMRARDLPRDNNT